MIADFAQYLVSALSLGGLYALMALGLVIVYGILRLINFAYGELVMVAGYGMLIFGRTPWPWIIVAVLSVVVAIVRCIAHGAQWRFGRFATVRRRRC